MSTDDDILYGQISRHQDKVWGREQTTILSRYLLPQMHGIRKSPGCKPEEKQWVADHLDRLQQLFRAGLGEKYLLDDDDRRLLTELIDWQRRPGAYPIRRFSDLDPYRSIDDLLHVLEYALV